ncbi:MAG: hypothetical protein P9M07_00600 [Candidatus Aceula meridiana]|nr:hypothetical protein [Candidatus Aceula meridiana]
MKQKTSLSVTKMIAVGICLLITAVAIFSLKYFKAKRLSLQAENKFYQQRSETAEERITQLDVLLGEYYEDIENFEKFLFKEKDIPLFLEDMSDSSEEFEIAVKNIQALEIKEVEVEKAPRTAEKIAQNQSRNSNKKELDTNILVMVSTPFKINIEGKFRDVLQFILSVEESRQLLTVSEVKISSRKYPVILGEFRLDLYSLSGLEEKKAE